MLKGVTTSSSGVGGEIRSPWAAGEKREAGTNTTVDRTFQNSGVDTRWITLGKMDKFHSEPQRDHGM